MKKMMLRSVISGFVLVMLSFPVTLFADTEREGRLALVLSGGGARGGAHVGVLKILEEHGITPDIVVGTSFGALVGGLYATGYSANEIEKMLTDSELVTLFQQFSPRESRSFQRKKDDDNLLVKFRLRLEGTNVILPNSLVSGHRLRLWLADRFRDRHESTTFQNLNVEFRTVTTNLLDGSEVVLADGPIEDAIYASMAVPGVMVGLEKGDALLVDGGMANNLPISVAKQLGATHVIAVDVGTPFYNKEEINTTFQAVDQIARLLTRGNTERTIANIDQNTLLISPDLDGVTTLAFDQIQEAITAGELSASVLREEIEEFKSLSSENRIDTIATTPIGTDYIVPMISSINIASDSALGDSYLRSHIFTEVNSPLNEALLDRDITRLYGTELFDRVDYRTIYSDNQIAIDIDAHEKRGRGFIQFGITLDEDFKESRNYSASVAYTKTQLNRWGADWRSQLSIGESRTLETEFYQPFGRLSEYFMSANSSYVRDRIDLSGENEKKGFENIDGFGFELEFGRHFGNWGRLSLSQSHLKIFSSSELLSNVDLGSTELSFERDTLDDPAFPTQGERVVINNSWTKPIFSDNSADEQTLTIDASKFFTRNRDTFGLWATFATNYVDEAGLGELSAGGFLNLSGFDEDELNGHHLAILRGLYYRRISGNPLSNFYDIPLYLGASVEYGNLWEKNEDISFSDTKLAGSLFIGGNSVIGPLFFGLGMTENSERALYFSVGRPFIYNQNRAFD